MTTNAPAARDLGAIAFRQLEQIATADSDLAAWSFTDLLQSTLDGSPPEPQTATRAERDAWLGGSDFAPWLVGDDQLDRALNYLALVEVGCATGAFGLGSIPADSLDTIRAVTRWPLLRAYCEAAKLSAPLRLIERLERARAGTRDARDARAPRQTYAIALAASEALVHSRNVRRFYRAVDMRERRDENRTTPTSEELLALVARPEWFADVILGAAEEPDDAPEVEAARGLHEFLDACASLEEVLSRSAPDERGDDLVSDCLAPVFAYRRATLLAFLPRLTERVLGWWSAAEESEDRRVRDGGVTVRERVRVLRGTEAFVREQMRTLTTVVEIAIS